MAIAFFNLLSENFHSKLVNCDDFDNLIEICVENIDEILLHLNLFMVLDRAIWKLVRLDYSVWVWRNI